MVMIINENLIKIITEVLQEVHDEYFEDDDTSIADKMYAQRFGITNQEPKQQQSLSDNPQNGKLIGYVNNSAYRKLDYPAPVFLNPKSLTDFMPNCRGAIMNDGNIYVATDNKVLHYNLLILLAEKNILPDGMCIKYDVEPYPTNFICVERINNTNNFEQSPVYKNMSNEFMQIFDRAEYQQPFGFKIHQIA
jgi:hypothetical protein